MKLLRFISFLSALTLALLLPAQAQQEVMPDIFDPIPSETPVPKPSANNVAKRTTARSKRRSAKATATKPTLATRAAAAPRRASTGHLLETGGVR